MLSVKKKNQYIVFFLL